MEAVLKAKDELGNDAVVLNVKTIKQKGLFKFLKPASVEVTVAKEEGIKEEKEAVKPAVEPVAGKNKIDAAADEDISIIPESILQKMEDKPNESVSKVITPEDASALEKKLEDLQNLLEKQIEIKTESEEEKEEEQPKSETSAFAQLLYNTLLDNDVDEKYANQFISEIEQNNNKEITIDHVLANIYQRMILKLGQASIITPAGNKPKVVFFIGPTGVGKTTTLAKIASKFHVNDGKKIVMLTADTYRIAATDQLRTYANIMGVPFNIIYSPEDMKSAVDEYKDYDYILVDTAGHSHKNQEQKQDTQSLLESIGEDCEKDVFLVVSAATKYRDLLRIVDAYNELTDYNIVFTKLDETTSLGNILNIKMYSGKNLSYITSGQNVPDDIEVFDAQSLVKQLLGGQ